MSKQTITAAIETIRQRDDVQCKQCCRDAEQGARLIAQLVAQLNVTTASNSADLGILCERRLTNSGTWGVN